MKSLSVITVTRNAAATIEATLRSIVGQTVFAEQIEFIVIDGASADGTPDIVRQLVPDAHLLSEPDQGIYDAMNKGLSLATAPWVLFMNAGDSLYDTTTVEQLHLDTRTPDHIIYGDHIVTHTDGSEMPAVALPFWQFPQYICGLGICHQSIYMPTAWMQQHPFDWQQYPHCADFEAIHYWHAQGKRFDYIARPLCRFEQGAGFSSRPEVQLLLLDENARIVGRRHSWTYYKLFLRYKLHIPGRPLTREDALG